MNLSTIFTNATKTVKSNSPEILTALAVSGVVTTAYLTGKASFKANNFIEEVEEENGFAVDPKIRFKIRVKLVWKYYIPAGVAGAVTIGCIIGSSKANGRRTTAAVTAYSLTEKAFTEYKEKVVEQIGKGKEQEITDKLAQARVENSPPGQIIVAGSGSVMCCELYTRRYFRSTMETLRKAQNDVNERVNSERYVTLDDFYDLVGLPNTSASNSLGWDSDKLMELKFSTVLSENGEPCLAFDYNYVKPL